MADDSITILEGPVKFRDGKKWKSRWCVLRRLSPVADAVELALYGESTGGGGGGSGGGAVGRCKATVSLAGWVGCTMGFPLDRQAHTLALLVAADAGADGAGAVLALESRAALLQWVARVEGALGVARRHHVAVVGGAAVTSQGTLLLTDRRMALVTGTPPNVKAVWELQHLRRFGVVEGRFVWEAGALAPGAASGVHCAASDNVTRLADDVRLAAQGLLEPRRRRRAATTEGGSPTSMRTSQGTLTRMPRYTTHRSASPAMSRDMPRCVSCSAALCLAAGASGTGFSPAWNMPPPRSSRVPTTPYDNYDVPKIPSIEAEGEYYDTPRRLRSTACMSRSLTAGALGSLRGCGARCAERRARRDDVSELYAVVDVSLKRRARCDITHYENGVFARSLRLYENARDVLPRANSAEYLPMRPRAPPVQQAAGYARMAPTARRRRAASNPLLVDEDGPWSGNHNARGGNRDSSSSGDSGVGGCEVGRLRRCRSCELALSPRAAPTNSSTSAEAAVPLHPRARSRTGDTRSTSSGTSDLSDYMETLSLSSHSSTDAHRLGGAPCRVGGAGGAGGGSGVHTLLRPRSGREYARALQLPLHTPHMPQPPLPPRAPRRPDV